MRINPLSDSENFLFCRLKLSHVPSLVQISQEGQPQSKEDYSPLTTALLAGDSLKFPNDHLGHGRPGKHR